MKVWELVSSLGASPDSLVCRPCRQDATRVVSFTSYTPRWEKRSCMCCISECSETFHSHMVVSDEEVATIECANLVCNTGDISTSIPLCKLHYSLIYQMLQHPRKLIVLRVALVYDIKNHMSVHSLRRLGIT